MITNPSSTLNSSRIEKRTPPTPEVGSKSERVKKQNMPSPLRRSGRSWSHSSLTPSDSKSSGSLSSKEKSVKQLAFEDEVENEQNLSGTSHTGKKRMDARQYRSLFRKANNGCKAENNVPEGFLVPSNATTSETKDDDSNLIPSSPGGYIVGTGRSCSKRRRVNCDPKISCSNESCDPLANELQDGGDIDASLLEKEYHANSQTDVAKNICLICKSDGQQLLFCSGKGCDRCYHLSCLETPLVDAPIGVWHCHLCVMKKFTLGVYSVSEGVESVFDVKEVPPSIVDGSAAQKEFLVKYKGLAHVHNQWIPENQLLLEAPSLIMNFNMKDQTQRLKPEWSLPHRLLQKRSIICSTELNNHSTNHEIDIVDCCNQWLVKWRGLGYEHATWELDNTSFLRSPEGQSLIRGYEERFQRAKRVSSCAKLDKKPARGNSVSKLCQMPGGVSSRVGSNNLDAVNKLREHWYQGQNAIVIDDHDRILKVVAFILSLRSDSYRPFLIISTAASLHSWEDEFYRLDPSIDVVIYSGNKEIRNSIRRLEFGDEEGCVLFQVLIVIPEILIEDLDVLGGIEWEAIIVDECQSPKVSPHFEKFKILNAHFRVLLFRGQLKDSIAEYINILALLDCHHDIEKDGLIPSSLNNIDQLKEKLSSHIAYRCKSDSFRLVEYWVPVQMSHLQLEQYCATLHSNASLLCLSSKMDTHALREVLITTRKCCSHPYTVDPSLKSSLTMGLEEVEYLDVEIKASGKLQLLDSLLIELRGKNLRGLVLFQSIGGSGRVSIGDYLDDFLRQRFGEDSYERVDKGLVASKKRDAMRKFNNKDNGRFVFLLETSACCPSIKLSSVDTIIIFDSDWNPMNDIRSLQKLTLNSQSELIKIFRLYSSFTVEGNALILAKQDKILDSNLQNINRNTSHLLLMLGASLLFDDLRVFHDGETSVLSLNSSSGQKLLTETIREFSSILSQDGKDNDTSNCVNLLKVQQNGVGGTYRADFPLLGEQKCWLLDEEPPHIFWTKLLEGKQFQWKYLHSTLQRSRKRVNHFDGSVKKAELVSEAIVTKKRRKASNNSVEQPSSKSEGVIKAGTSGDPADRPQRNDAESEKKTTLLDEQRSLHLKLKPEIAKLCEVLLLPDNVKILADHFLEYIMNYHHVITEPVSILQAFQISLILTAAALLKYKLDRKASLLQAKQHLNFDCKKEEVDYICSMLCCSIFLYRRGSSEDTYSPIASESSKRIYSNTELAPEVELIRKKLFRSIKDIRKKCGKQLKKLSCKHQEEKQRLENAFEDEKAGIERTYKVELAIIRSFSPSDVMRTEKLKALNSEHDNKIGELKRQHGTRLKALEHMQLAERQKYKDKEDTWVEDVNSWAQNELSNIVASKEHSTGVEYLQTCDQEQPQDNPRNVPLMSNHFTQGKDHANIVEDNTRSGTGVPEIESPAIVLCSRPVELQTQLIKHTADDEIDNMASENRPLDCHDIADNQNDGLGGATTMTDEGRGCENFSQVSRDGVEDDTSFLRTPGVDVMDPPEEARHLSSLETPHDQGTAGEMQNSSEQQQLPASEGPSSNQHSSNLISASGVEQQSTTSKDDLLRNDVVASTSVQNQVVEPDSNLELDPNTHQVVRSAADTRLPSMKPIGIRTEPSNTSNLSTSSNINNLPTQTASQSASRMLPPMCPDPLKNELERIRSSIDHLVKDFEDVQKSRLKSDFEKEFEELRKKYDTKFQEIEIEYQQRKKNLDTCLRTVVANKILADAFRSKCTDRKTSDARGMPQDALAQQLAKQQQSAPRPFHIAGPSSCPPPPVSSMQSPSAAASSPNMLSTMQAVYHTSRVFSITSPRVPLRNNSIPLSSVNFQVGAEIRAPAPHLRPFRPSTFMSAPVLATPSPSFGHAGPQPQPQPKPMMIRPDSHTVLQPDSTGGYPANNLPAMDLLANANSQSATLLPNALASNGSVPPNSSNQAISSDFVCLSDDE